jgi:hypothetical protein
MALITDPEASRPDTIRAIKRAMRVAELAPAGMASQLATYAQIVLAMSLTTVVTQDVSAVVIASLTLAVGLVIGLATPVGGWFTNLSGFVAAIVAMFVAFIVLAFGDGRVFGDEPWLAPLLVFLGVLGLDWRFAPRLRARAIGSGLVVIPILGAEGEWIFAAAIAWFLGVLVTLWLIERDVRRAAMRPTPLIPQPSPARNNTIDLLRSATLGLGVGLFAAVLLTDASCSAPSPTVDVLPRPDTPPFEPGSGGSFTSPLVRPIPGVGDPLDGATDHEIDERGRIVITGRDGSTFTFDQDGQGRDRVTVEDSGGTRTFIYDERGSETRITEYDERGNEVAEYSIERGQSADADPRPRPDDPEDSPDINWLAIAVAALAVVAIALVLHWLLRRRSGPPTERSWAEQLAARLDHEGRRRGHGRDPGETVAHHARALADGPLPDHRIAAVGRLLSNALYGRNVPGDDARAWAQNVVDEVSAAYPARRGSR